MKCTSVLGHCGHHAHIVSHIPVNFVFIFFNLFCNILDKINKFFFSKMGFYCPVYYDNIFFILEILYKKKLKISTILTN